MELLLDPMLRRFGKILMSISTLGLRSIQNNIYSEVARGHRNRSTRLLMMIILVGISIPFSVINGIENRNKLFQDDLKQAIQILKEKNISEDDMKGKIDPILHKLRDERNNDAKIKITLMTSFIWCVLIFQYFKLVLVESSISRFYRCLNICLPFITEDEEKTSRSDFSLISSKEDYFALMDNFKEIAKRGNITLPQ